MRAWLVKHAIIEFGADHPLAWVDDDGESGPIYPLSFPHQKPAAFLTIDDRAVCFEGDWSDFEPADLLNFKPWNKK